MAKRKKTSQSKSGSARPSSAPESSPHQPRLQKVLAAAGYGSRRECEELILEGRVEIDRKVVEELGTRVDVDSQEVRVDGEVVRISKPRYFMLNKPVDVLSTNRDPWARTRVIDLIDTEDRLFTVGRLDKSSSGLILVTNDGDLANRLAHPRYKVTKTYHAVVRGKPDIEIIKKLRQGVHLAEGFAQAVSVRIKSYTEQKATLEIVLDEGKNREIRRMLARVGHKVLQLKRVALGPLKLGELPTGAYRELTRDEIAALRAATQDSPESRPKKKAKPKPNSKFRSNSTSKAKTKTKSRSKPSGDKSVSAGGKKRRRPTAAAKPTKAAGRKQGRSQQPRHATADQEEQQLAQGHPKKRNPGQANQS